MTNSHLKPSDFEHILQEAESELNQSRSRLFSPEGFVRLSERIAQFIGKLTIESARIARRHQADSVSPAYVDRAAEHIASGRAGRFRKMVEGLGSIILGIGLATAGTMDQTGDYTTRGVVLSVVCIIVGMPAFLFHLIRE